MKYFSFRLFYKDFSFNVKSTCVSIKYLNPYLDYFLMQNDHFKDVIIDGSILYFVEKKSVISYCRRNSLCSFLLVVKQQLLIIATLLKFSIWNSVILYLKVQFESVQLVNKGL